ncbi:YdcF family protein [Candidatus Parcubacteria bacterium]|nr:YdcF family protein [Candidatus Parcubacteria bacterium]
MSSSDRWAVIAALGGDLSDFGGRIGLETRAHCHEAAYVYRELKPEFDRAIILVSAGMAPKDAPRQQITMAQMMSNFLVMGIGIDSRDVHIAANPDGKNVWGTRKELEPAIRYRRNIGTDEPVHVVSSRYHLFRSGMIAKVGFGEKVILHGAWGRPSNAFEEIWKIPGEFLRLKWPRFDKWIDRVRRRSI